MSNIKVANEVVVENAKSVMRDIQRERHREEFEDMDAVEEDFDSLNMDWVFRRDFSSWFEFFGPLAILGFIGYPFSVISRLYSIRHKPKKPTVFEKATYLYKVFDDTLFYSIYILESEYSEKRYDYCKKLKCMAKNNEMGHMEITKEEAEYLGIC